MKVILNKLKHLYISRFSRIEDYLLRENLKKHIHLMENSEVGIIFLKDPVSIFTCPRELKRTLNDFLKGETLSEVCFKHSIPLDNFYTLLHFLFDKLEAPFQNTQENIGGNNLNRLVLNVNNTCNLKCKYCYAQGGNYGFPESFMDKRVAIAVLDKLYQIFETIDNVQFFGGEPLINARLILLICDEIKKRHKNGIIKQLPHFSVVTNGTYLTEEILQLLRHHAIVPTISLDGPKDIQDYLRGGGTFAKVTKFINSLEKNNIDYSFESTYTAYHLESGMTISQLMDFFLKTFRRTNMHIPPAALPAGHPLSITPQSAEKIYREAVDYSIDNMKEGKSPCLSFASRIMDAFIEHKPIRQYCPAGYSTLSVDTEGSVYPCFMFTGINDFKLGNVFEDAFPDNVKIEEVFEKIIYPYDKDKDPRCLECWASPFCSGCIGADYITSGGTREKVGCNVVKSMAEGFLLRVIGFFDRIPKDLTQGKEEKGGENHKVTWLSIDGS